MLQYECKDLSEASLAALRVLQARVGAGATHAEKYEIASALFKNKTAAVWREVKENLALVSPPGDSCFYCERDRYRDIDHVRPKRHYPEFSFVWGNYVYSCPICNQSQKRDTYAVFDVNGDVVVFDRSHPIDTPVPVGDHVLIDLRTENPLNFLQLDLETGRFVPVGDVRSRHRGQFTRDLFKLNNSALAKIRVQAYRAFVDYLTRYQQAFARNDVVQSELILSEIRSLQHPTVLAEMKRQRALIDTLPVLFENLPEDVGSFLRS